MLQINICNLNNYKLFYLFLELIEDNLIVGILTQTNQFIQVVPPSENIEEDGLTIINNSNYLNADKKITVSKKQDEERIEITKKIYLEIEFYTAFRSTIRILMNRYENKEKRDEMRAKSGKAEARADSLALICRVGFYFILFYILICMILWCSCLKFLLGVILKGYLINISSVLFCMPWPSLVHLISMIPAVF